MNKPLFTNVMTTKANPQKVKDFLKNIQNSLKWNPEIETVEPAESGYQITRTSGALNTSEMIEVVEAGNNIMYQSTGGRLAYELEFLIEPELGQRTKITQTVFIPEETDLHLPIKLLKPIAKQAFSKNLKSLTVALDKLAH